MHKLMKLLALGLVISVTAGCLDDFKNDEALVKKLQDHASRLAALEKENGELRVQLGELRLRYEKTQNHVAGMEKANVTTTAEIDDLVTQAVQDELTEREKAREKERAEEHREREQRVRDRMAEYREEQLKETVATLELDDKQKTELQQADSERSKAREALYNSVRQGGNRDWRKMREDFGKIEAEYDKKMVAILTEEQYKNFKERQTSRRRSWGSRDDRASRTHRRPSNDRSTDADKTNEPDTPKEND